MKRKKTNQSVFFRLFLTIFLVLIPMNIILMVYAVYMFDSTRKQQIQERTSVLNMYISSFDAAVGQATTAFYRENASYDALLLKQSGAERSENSIEWYAARTRIMNTYNQWLQDNSVFDGFFSYYDYDGEEVNSYAIKNRTGQAITDINRRIIDYVENNQQIEKGVYQGNGWHHIKIEKEDFLVLEGKSGNCFYGGWINLNRLLAEWNDQSQPTFYLMFADSEGKICYGRDEKANSFIGEDEYKKGRNIAAVQSENTGLYLFTEAYDVYSLGSVPVIVAVLSVFTILALLAIPILVFVTKRYILKPIKQLLSGMDHVRKGDLTYQIPMSKVGGEFAIMDDNFNRMVRELHDVKIAAYESEMERQRIQMRYLSQQIQPHFVLNTLNILYSYEPEEYGLIQKMILCLSKYFRYVVKVNSDFVKLKQELAHIKNYFEIQMARYPEQIDYYVETEEGMDDLLIPPLLIQNFTENSIKYAISMERKVSIYVLVQFYEKNKMRIRIADTGKGFPEEVLKAIGKFRETHKYQEGLGIGIQNAIERLEILYHGIPQIMFYNSTSGGATVDIIMPCIKREETEGKDNEDSVDRR